MWHYIKYVLNIANLGTKLSILEVIFIDTIHSRPKLIAENRPGLVNLAQVYNDRNTPKFLMTSNILSTNTLGKFSLRYRPFIRSLNYGSKELSFLHCQTLNDM